MSSGSCASCGHQLREDARYCPSCGQSATATTTIPSWSPTAPPPPPGQPPGPPPPPGPTRTGLLATVLTVVLVGLALGLAATVYLLWPSDASEEAATQSEPTSTEALGPGRTGATGTTPTSSPGREFQDAVVPLPIASATASSSAPDGFDAAENPTTFGAGNLVDGDVSTAWRTAGPAIGETIVIRFDEVVRLREIGLVPGYAKTDPYDETDRFRQNRRVTSVRYEFDDGTSVQQSFVDSRELQSMQVDVETATVTIEILGSTSDGGRDFTAISEIVARGSLPR